MDEWLTTQEAAGIIKISRVHLLRLVREGKIEAALIGGSAGYRFRRADVQQFITDRVGRRQKAAVPSTG